MSLSLQVLLLVGAVLLMASAGAGSRLLRLRKRDTALQQRVEAVAAPWLRDRPAQASMITRRPVDEPQALARHLAGLFGYKCGFDEGLRWYYVLPVTLAISFGVAEMSGVLLGSMGLAGVPVIWVMLSRSVWGWRRDKRLALLLSQFPDALAMIVRSVRVGIPVAQSVSIVAREAREPTAHNFGELANEVAIGMPLETALRQMADRTGLTEYRFFATAIGLQTQTGGALSETLENLADVIRRRLALRARGRALSSEARASCLMLAVLPPVIGFLMYLLNPGYIGLLFTDPTGRRLLGLAVVSLALGLFAMRTIVKRVLA